MPEKGGDSRHGEREGHNSMKLLLWDSFVVPVRVPRWIGKCSEVLRVKRGDTGGLENRKVDLGTRKGLRGGGPAFVYGSRRVR